MSKQNIKLERGSSVVITQFGLIDGIKHKLITEVDLLDNEIEFSYDNPLGKVEFMLKGEKVNGTMRVEPITKEMKLEDIELQLGYKIKIIDC